MPLEKHSIKNLPFKKDAKFVLEKHSNDPATALIELFPDIGFTKSKFLTPGKKL